MRLVLFCHPSFLSSQSMPRYAQWLKTGMEKRGHEVQLWQPEPRIYNFPAPAFLKKWLGYVDQFVVFPSQVRKKIKNTGADTLFIFTDHAQGIWVPLASELPHVVHCHDFLAQQSALGMIPENPVGWTGKKYQELIRKGYRRAKNFISVSCKTKEDLNNLLNIPAQRSEVVYNGLTQKYSVTNRVTARKDIGRFCNQAVDEGYLLHVGGNHWYKNRAGVVMIYNAWRDEGGKLPLLLIGEHPNEVLQSAHEKSQYGRDIYFLENVPDALLPAAYSGAVFFLFPSLAEGFGWPIAEAMACGCPVMTTNEAPMTEVAGDSAVLIPRMPSDNEEKLTEWATNAAVRLMGTISSGTGALVEKGINNVKRFDSDLALDSIEEIYFSILDTSSGPQHRS